MVYDWKKGENEWGGTKKGRVSTRVKRHAREGKLHVSRYEKRKWHVGGDKREREMPKGGTRNIFSTLPLSHSQLSELVT